MCKKNILSLFVIAIVSCTGHAFENLGSSSAAMGGASAGAIDALDGAFNNPASVALFSQKSAALSLAHNSVRLSLSDNGTEALFPAMLGYSETDRNFLKTKSFYLGVSYAFTPRVAMGVNVGFQQLKTETSSEKHSQNIADVGAVVQLSPGLSLGVVLQNKALNDTDLADTIDDRPLVSGGIEAKYDDMLALRFDLESGKNDQLQERQTYKTGLLIQLNQWLMARLGYQNNNVLNQNYFTAGLGFGGPQFGLHYAYVKESEFAKEAFHSIDLAVPF